MINSEKICRICMEEDAVLDLYAIKSTGESAKTMMDALFSFKVNINDGLPNRLCKKCSTKVTSSYKLKQLAEATNEKLTKCFIAGDVFSVESAFATIITDSKSCINIKIETNHEDFIEKEDGIKEEQDGQSTNEYLNVDPITEYAEDCNNFQNDDINTDFVYAEDLPINTDNESANKLTKGEKKVVKKRKKVIKKGYKKKVVSDKCKGRKKKEKVGTMCDVCGKVIKNMKEHKLIHLPNKRLFQCGLCPKVFQSRSSRRSHNSFTHLGFRYFCPICKKFYSVTETDHKRIHHSNRQRIYECSYCSTKFFSKGTLKIHINTHTKEKAHLCTVCGKGFNTKSDANYHKRCVHDKEKPHICQYCSKAFFYTAKLKEHIRVHTNEGFNCPDCGKMFTSIRAMAEHKKLHGKKEIKCELCDKEFHRRGNLTLHMISHTKEKKHSCKYCGVKFGRTDHRNRHERTAHESKIQG